MCVKPHFLYAGALILFVWNNSTSVQWIYNWLVPRGAMGMILLWAKCCSNWWLPCVLAGSTSYWGRKKVQLHTSFIRAGIWFLPVHCLGRTHFRGEEVSWPRLLTTAPRTFLKPLHTWYPVKSVITFVLSLISHSRAASIRSFGAKCWSGALVVNKTIRMKSGSCHFS